MPRVSNHEVRMRCLTGETEERAVHSPPSPLAVGTLRCYITPREAASRVRSHISPGPYRSFRELSLSGSVDPDIWCPPTFVGNSGIERSNGDRGFALSLAGVCAFHPNALTGATRDRTSIQG